MTQPPSPTSLSALRAPRKVVCREQAGEGQAQGDPLLIAFYLGCLGQWPPLARSKTFDGRCSMVGKSLEFPWDHPEGSENCYKIILIRTLSTRIPASFPLSSSTRKAGKWKTHLPGSKLGVAMWHGLANQKEVIEPWGFPGRLPFPPALPSSSFPSETQMW